MSRVGASLACGARVANHRAMHRALPLSLLSLSLACTQLDEPASASPAEASKTPTSASAMTNASSGEAGSAELLSTPVRELATASTTVDKLKLRFNGEGKLVKQALYHGEAAAAPAALVDAVKERYPGHSIRGYETEHYADLGAVFEIEFETSEGQHCELAAREDGSVIYTECRVDPAELPESIIKNIDGIFSGSKVLEAEFKTMDEQESYSVEFEHEGREYYFHFDAEGQVTSKHVLVPAVVELPLP